MTGSRRSCCIFFLSRSARADAGSRCGGAAVTTVVPPPFGTGLQLIAGALCAAHDRGGKQGVHLVIAPIGWFPLPGE